MCNEIIDKLDELVAIYACMDEVSSGDAIRDEGFLEAFDIILSDLRSLIQDHKEFKLGPPHIPVGFKLHAVIH